MPWFSYHSGHSGGYCRHAKGDLAQVVERAYRSGFTHYGLSEHCPRDDPRWFFPGEEDLTPASMADMFRAYALEARRLRDEYADRLELLVGFETEMLPRASWATRMAELRAEGGFEYVVGSVHSVGDHWVDFNPEHTRAAEEAFGGRQAWQIAYFDAVAELTTQLRPEVTGHIDLVRKFDGPAAAFEAPVQGAIERALEAVRAVGAVLDVNPGAQRRGLSPVYPLPSILSRARQMGIGVTLGDDSHGPDSVGAALPSCLSVIAAAGYDQVQYLTRRDGVVQWQAAALADVKPRPVSGT